MPASRASSSATPIALDGLAQSHVVGQDRAAGAGREGDAVELIGQQLDL